MLGFASQPQRKRQWTKLFCIAFDKEIDLINLKLNNTGFMVQSITGANDVEPPNTVVCGGYGQVVTVRIAWEATAIVHRWWLNCIVYHLSINYCTLLHTGSPQYSTLAFTRNSTGTMYLYLYSSLTLITYLRVFVVWLTNGIRCRLPIYIRK